ncbi:MAG TPA: glycosyltransferase family A protein [Thermoanaerobaculia bacterium]|nr:glycosyltransferase family A protein [Thermoanaerobaculia bacterium]
MTFRIITNCGPAEAYIARCIASVQEQTVRDWTCTITIDPCGDATYDRAVIAAAGDPRFHIRVNEERRWAMHNLVSGIGRSGAGEEDVIVTLDGDDRFATPRALQVIGDTYRRSDCWMTYGSWVAEGVDESWPVHTRGSWEGYPDGTSDFRSGMWLGTAVRTFRKWLWDLVDDADLRDEDGEYYRIVEDQACMIPMLEMATTRRARHIADILLVYNRANPQAVGRVMHGEMLATTERIRARRPYAPLPGKPTHPLHTRHVAAWQHPGPDEWEAQWQQERAAKRAVRPQPPEAP